MKTSALARADELLAAVRAVGATIRRDGNFLDIEAPAPLPRNLLARLREAKPIVMAALHDAAELRDRYEDRVAICEHEGGLGRVRAEALAWLEVAVVWHRQHGDRIPACLCAGCGEPITDELSVLLLPHGERAHTRDGSACILDYSRRWQAEAVAALATIGIPTPRRIVSNIHESTEDCDT
jgi:hypothetical protein